MVKSPLIIKDYINPVETTRKQLMNETASKIKGAKDFTFKPYITEKERIVINRHLLIYRSNTLRKERRMVKTLSQLVNCFRPKKRNRSIQGMSNRR